MNACTMIVKDRPRKEPRRDSISNIHNNILRHIFSYLPIEDVVRTSILSKDWKYKWTCSYKLDIRDHHWVKEPHSFVNFLNTTIPSIQCLRIFKLWCCMFTNAEGNDFQRWISTVLEHDDLEIFKLILLTPIVLPCSLLNSTSLTQLYLSPGLKSTLKVSMNNVASKLTYLCLWSVNIVSASPTLTFTFPVLEKMSLKHHEWLNVKSITIHAPSLTILTSAPGPGNRIKDYDYSIAILAPKVTIFDCTTILENITLNGSSVVSAYMRLDHDPKTDVYLRRQVGSRVGKLLNKFTNLEDLVLYGSFTKESQSTFPFCCHNKLRRLSLPFKGGHKLLFELLHAAPSLKFLFIHLYKWRPYKYEALESIPACITSQLEEVVLQCYLPAIIYDLAKFMFKNAVHLKKFSIYLVHKPAVRVEVIERLSSIPRCSTSLTIDVVTTSYMHEYSKYDTQWRSF